MVFCAVEKLQNKPDKIILDKMYAQHEKNQLVNTIQLAEAEMILNEITAKGIDILPLKGYVLKSLYPDSNYRQMGDLDYLLEEENLSKAGQILQELGYTADDVGLEDSHDVYTKNRIWKWSCTEGSCRLRRRITGIQTIFGKDYIETKKISISWK